MTYSMNPRQLSLQFHFIHDHKNILRAYNTFQTGQVWTVGRPPQYRSLFALSCWKMHGDPWKRCVLEGSIHCCKISVDVSLLMLPSQKWKWALPGALIQPSTITEPGFRSGCWQQSGFSFCSLVRSTQRPFLPTKILNIDWSDHNTRFHCVMVHPRCLWA